MYCVCLVVISLSVSLAVKSGRGKGIKRQRQLTYAHLDYCSSLLMHISTIAHPDLVSRIRDRRRLLPCGLTQETRVCQILNSYYVYVYNSSRIPFLLSISWEGEREGRVAEETTLFHPRVRSSYLKWRLQEFMFGCSKISLVLLADR